MYIFDLEICMKNKAFLVWVFLCPILLASNEVSAQSSGSGNASGGGNRPSVRVDPRLQGRWKVLIAQIQDPTLAVIFKQDVVFADVGRTSVLPWVGNAIIKVERCDYTLDRNGSLSQIIQLDNGITWGVSPIPGSLNYLLQVIRTSDGKELGRLLFKIIY